MSTASRDDAWIDEAEAAAAFGEEFATEVLSPVIATYTMNRSDWTGRDGTVKFYADGTFDVEGIGKFKIVETVTPDEDGDSGWDYIGWRAVSADGQWDEKYALAKGGDFRKDATKRDWVSADATSADLSRGSDDMEGKIPREHHRAMASARVMWMTV